jgi:hypothetical protein
VRLPSDKRFKNLTGERFGLLRVVKLYRRKKERTFPGHYNYWSCRCKCGGYKLVITSRLTSGEVTHCGCKRKPGRNRLELKGQRFGRWLVLEFAGVRRRNNGYCRTFWKCRCDCGTLRTIAGTDVKHLTRSCGCGRKGKCGARIKHGYCVGGRAKPEYDIYYSAKDRCENPRSVAWNDYGGRGIQFKFKSFIEFINHVGPRPAGRTLDRIDVNGHYEIGNVRWATWEQQMANRRCSLGLENSAPPDWEEEIPH